MSIAFYQDRQAFYLSGGNVSYILHVDQQGTLMNLYWGKRVPDNQVIPRLDAYVDKRTDLPFEVPVRGTGWYGTPAVDVLNAQGNDVVELKYADHRIYAGKKPLRGLPATYVEDEGEADSLEIELKDPLTDLTVTVVYCMYRDSGALTRSMRIRNDGKEALRIKGAKAASVPLYGFEYEAVHLKGEWGRECSVTRTPLGKGEYRISSQRGASSHIDNPFLALCRPWTTEHDGEVWAANFVYSGSFMASASADGNNNTRLTIGMEENTFAWHLDPDEEFTVPEAVLVYSPHGLNGMSQIYHKLYRTRLVRGAWRDQVRPILINNWEATYYAFDEEKLLDIAKAAKEIGVELFVLDDGWFGKRDQDNSSLGDWVVDKRKLPHGLKALAENIQAIGMQFGLWFEPEMVSPDSDLYRAHPDWCLHVAGRKRTERRKQLVLDLSRQEVQEYIIESVSAVLQSAPISYLKWDMNRYMTEHFSGTQAPHRQMETQHRYMLGLYRVIEELRTRFPEVLFEGCASGGGRFDPGMLYYTPQIWTSDDTDAVERLSIQYGTSFAYPASAMGAHVSAVPNHQTGRITSMDMRGNVAIGGNFGFELDLSTLSEQEMDTAKALVARVKKYRALTQQGVFTRLLSPFEGQYAAWQFTSEDKTEALLCVYKILDKPRQLLPRVQLQNLDATAIYVDDDGQCHHGLTLMNMGMWIQCPGDFSSKVIYLQKKQ